MEKVNSHEKFGGVYEVAMGDGSRRLATLNLTPGKQVYGESLINSLGQEYRFWDPFRSKLAAALLKGMSILPIQPGHRVLYLGASTGTTASHVSDIVGDNGHVYCVEFAPRVMRELTNNVSSYRKNMSPILADARMPNKYRMLIGNVTDIYCDVAQPEQAKIVADNADMFLDKGGWIMLAVKARSVDVTKEPAEVYRIETNVLKQRGFAIKETIHLEPYDKAHAMIVAQYP